MRVVKEFVKEDIRISIFSWNNKYLIKFELGPMEQTFKVPEMDILEESDLAGFYEGEFWAAVQNRFKEMGQTLQKQLENL
ncbi:hypothetical protein Belba_3558 [Belliella baltica DSM 15883]|uniref:Uncharacterized protein n=1 Tax=Belliella baltica (strain DSM 15883 / CIP 108006 / LMG 21964 / BA134) TaxID=866536 RepID=I3Z9Y8_BELBD|nr:hypothetical protein [Belliella baltica]AFL86056.1 hypothetical protein Belba_3558 [Belliella baltica DSM 15883]